jgi:hypothetical protein
LLAEQAIRSGVASKSRIAALDGAAAASAGTGGMLMFTAVFSASIERALRLRARVRPPAAGKRTSQPRMRRSTFGLMGRSNRNARRAVLKDSLPWSYRDRDDSEAAGWTELSVSTQMVRLRTVVRNDLNHASFTMVSAARGGTFMVTVVAAASAVHRAAARPKEVW